MTWISIIVIRLGPGTDGLFHICQRLTVNFSMVEYVFHESQSPLMHLFWLLEHTEIFI